MDMQASLDVIPLEILVVIMGFVPLKAGLRLVCNPFRRAADLTTKRIRVFMTHQDPEKIAAMILRLLRLPCLRDLQITMRQRDNDAPSLHLLLDAASPRLEVLEIITNGKRHNTPLHLLKEDVASITSALSRLTSLQTLSMERIPLGAALAPVLQQLTGLQSLTLRSDVLLDAPGVYAVATTLPQLAGLTSLDLGGNDLCPVGTQGFAGLAPSLSQLSGLRSLMLNSCGLDDRDAPALAAVISQMPGLRSLNLGSNILGEECAEALVPSLVALTALQNLDLSKNFLCDNGIVALSPALATMTALKVLNLRDNEIFGSGAAALGTALVAMTALQSLDLLQNRISNQGIAELVPALLLTGLTQFRLGCLSIDICWWRTVVSRRPQQASMLQLVSMLLASIENRIY